MKRILISLVFLSVCFCFQANAQKLPQTERGDRFFDKFDFSKAIYFYEIAHEKEPNDPYITRQLAKAYDHIGDPMNTAIWYNITLNLDSTNSEDMLQYAEALKSLEQYEKSLVWYEKYKEINPADSRASEHLKDKRFYINLKEDSVKYSVKKLEFNNNFPAFGLTPFDGRFIFSSSGVETSAIEETNPWDELPYLDLYECELDGNKEFTNIKPLQGAVNSKFHDGPACYDPSTGTLYITRNNMENGKPVRDKTGTVNLKIYQTTFTESGWTEVRELDFNSESFSNGHPTISADGRTMYFVSNRPGGFGGTDIYRTLRQGESWSEPENLGPNVNSKGDEMFPYVSDDNSLYFASNGHVGLGGLDIFKTMEEKGKWTTPDNLGYPVNTPMDDFSIFYDSDNQDGYFSSNRDGVSGDDLYYFETLKVIRKIIAGQLEVDNPDRGLAGQKLILENITTGLREEISVDNEMRFRAELSADSDYKLMIVSDTEAVGDSTSKEKIVFQNSVDSPIDDPYEDIGPIAVKSITENVEEIDEMAIVEEHLPEIKSDPPDLVEEASPDETIPATIDASEMLAERDVSNIYFDFDKSAIRERDMENLKRLSELMKEDARYVLHITCHTDSRGSKDYNEKLSKRRAESAREYLISLGVDAEQINIEWKGEEKLVNRCADGVKCAPEEHQRNRRGSFSLFKKRDLPA